MILCAGVSQAVEFPPQTSQTSHLTLCLWEGGKEILFQSQKSSQAEHFRLKSCFPIVFKFLSISFSNQVIFFSNITRFLKIRFMPIFLNCVQKNWVVTDVFKFLHQDFQNNFTIFFCSCLFFLILLGSRLTWKIAFFPLPKRTGNYIVYCQAQFLD